MAGMAEEVSSIIAAARAKLQAELDAQLGIVAEQHRRSLDTARREAARAAKEADDRWLVKLRTTEEEASSSVARVRDEVARVRDEMEKALKAGQADAEARRLAQNGFYAVLREVDAAHTVSQTLDAIARGASLTAARSALFIVQDEHLAEWAREGSSSADLTSARARRSVSWSPGDGVSRAQRGP